MDRWTELLALSAAVIGLGVVVIIWPRRGPDTRGPSLPHPTSAAPVRVRLDTYGDEPRWRVANRHALLDVTVDIVTFRATGSTAEWVSEPIVEPIRLSPGRSTMLSTVVADPEATYDVVVAWTTHHLGGGVESTRTFTVGPNALDAVAPVPVVPTASVGTLRVVFGVAAVLLVGLAGAAVSRLVDGDGTTSADETRPGGATTTEATAGSTSSTSSPGTTAATTVPAPTATAAPATAAVTGTTAVPSTATADVATTSSSTTTGSSTSTSSPTTTSNPATTTTTSLSTTSTAPSDPRRVTITGRVEDCRFGPDCLIADFTLAGFPREGEYVCEFDDGSRFTFRYVGDGADDACTSSGSSPSITIEVDGVRSATITGDSLTGN